MKTRNGKKSVFVRQFVRYGLTPASVIASGAYSLGKLMVKSAVPAMKAAVDAVKSGAQSGRDFADNLGDSLIEHTDQLYGDD